MRGGGERGAERQPESDNAIGEIGATQSEEFLRSAVVHDQRWSRIGGGKGKPERSSPAMAAPVRSGYVYSFVGQGSAT